MTGTGTSNFSSAAVNAYIRTKTLELGDRKYLWRKFVDKEKIEAGNGTVWRAVRYLRLDVPLAGLTEGTAPTETDLANETVTCTAIQYGLTVKITDVLELTIKSKPLQQAIKMKSDVMVALDDLLLANIALTGTNVLYGGTATARSGLTAAGGDVLTSTLVRKAVASLRSTDGVKGAAPVHSSGKYVALVHEKQVFDLQKDATWEAAATRNGAMVKEMQDGFINDWAGAHFYSSDFLPVFYNISNGTGGAAAIASGVAVTTTRGLDGFTITAGVGGSLTSSTAHYFKVVRKHKKRGFAEGISIEHTQTSGSGGNDESFTCLMPDDTNYVYDLYVGLSAGALYRVAANQAADASVLVDAVTDFASTNALAPVAPPQHTTSITATVGDVYPLFIFGMGAIAAVDLAELESYLVKGPDSSNPLNQFAICGSKFFVGQCLTQGSFLQRIESQSAFSS